VTVISMADFLAWRRGEKNIPAKSALIGIDDGYISGYGTAWPILQKFGYPFTMYIYTDFVKGGKNAGGASMTWEQLAEMVNAGVDIGSHTLSHSALNRKRDKSEAEYREWLKAELGESKRILEEKLGIPIKTIAYPYGLHNEIVREVAMESGYEAAFTVYGQRLAYGAEAAMLGRYAIESTKPQIFQQAANFSGSVEGAPATTGGKGAVGSPAMAVPAAASMVTMPMQGETLSDSHPVLKANLATLGKNIDPKSVEMRVSGFGQVPADYDPETRLIQFKMHQPLREKTYYVVVSARADGRKKEAGWSFNFERNITLDPTPEPTPAPTPDDMEGIPAMKPAA